MLEIDVEFTRRCIWMIRSAGGFFFFPMWVSVGPADISQTGFCVLRYRRSLRNYLDSLVASSRLVRFHTCSLTFSSVCVTHVEDTCGSLLLPCGLQDLNTDPRGWRLPSWPASHLFQIVKSPTGISHHTLEPLCLVPESEEQLLRRSALYLSQ